MKVVAKAEVASADGLLVVQLVDHGGSHKRWEVVVSGAALAGWCKSFDEGDAEDAVAWYSFVHEQFVQGLL